jgi:hypothetical protein
MIVKHVHHARTLQKQVTRQLTASATLDQLGRMVECALSASLANIRLPREILFAQIVQQRCILLQLVPHITHAKNARQTQTRPKQVMNKQIVPVTLATQGPTGIGAQNVLLENLRLQRVMQYVQIVVPGIIPRLWLLSLTYVKNAQSTQTLQWQAMNRLTASATLVRLAQMEVLARIV